MEGEQPENATNNPIDTNENAENAASGSNTKKKKRSDVWPHFTIFLVLEKDVPIPTEYAQCNYCTA